MKTNQKHAAVNAFKILMCGAGQGSVVDHGDGSSCQEQCDTDGAEHHQRKQKSPKDSKLVESDEKEMSESNLTERISRSNRKRKQLKNAEISQQEDMSDQVHCNSENNSGLNGSCSVVLCSSEVSSFKRTKKSDVQSEVSSDSNSDIDFPGCKSKTRSTRVLLDSDSDFTPESRKNKRKSVKKQTQSNGVRTQSLDNINKTTTNRGTVRVNKHEGKPNIKTLFDVGIKRPLKNKASRNSKYDRADCSREPHRNSPEKPADETENDRRSERLGPERVKDSAHRSRKRIKLKPDRTTDNQTEPSPCAERRPETPEMSRSKHKQEELSVDEKWRVASRRSLRISERCYRRCDPASSSSDDDQNDDDDDERRSGKENRARIKRSSCKKSHCQTEDVEIIEGDGKPQQAVDAFKMMYKNSRAKLSKQQLEARRLFLNSGIPDELVQQTETIKILEYSTVCHFPPVSHVTQLADGVHHWSSRSVHDIVEGVTLLPAIRPSELRPLKWTLCRAVSDHRSTRSSPTPAPLDWDQVAVTVTKLPREDNAHLPWCQQHPLIGEHVLDRLVDWLSEWRDPAVVTGYHDDSSDDVTHTPALLLSGPRGSGKTWAVYSAAARLGYQVLEVNTSNVRSGKQLAAQVTEATRSQHQVTGNSLLLIDDVHLASATHDDGFSSSLASLASRTRRPILLTSEDCLWGASSRAVPHQHLRVSPPERLQLVWQLAAVSLTHGVWPGERVLHELSRSRDGRQALLQLQFLCASRQHFSSNSMKSGDFLASVGVCSENISALISQLPDQIVFVAAVDTCCDTAPLTQSAVSIDHLSCASADLTALNLHWWSVTPAVHMSSEENATSDVRVKDVSDEIYDHMEYCAGHKCRVEERQCLSSIWHHYCRTAGVSVSNMLSRRSMTLDVLPSIRQICRLEALRRSATGARRNRRFLHYLDSVGVPSFADEIRSECCLWLADDESVRMSK